MSQNDLVIANQNFPATRADINSALQALGSTNSGATEPTITYASMLWHDTTAEVLKIRAEANDAWITLGYLNQSTDTFSLLDDTQTVSTLGVQTGLLGDQATTTWEGGTGTLQSLVSPANVKAAVEALSPVKAWVSLTGSTGAIRASSGVASVTRNSVGDYTITFTAGLMPDANYASLALGSQQSGGTGICNLSLVSQATASCRIVVQAEYVGSPFDPAIVNMSFMR
jgi:hypothetical protein